METLTVTFNPLIALWMTTMAVGACALGWAALKAANEPFQSFPEALVEKQSFLYGITLIVLVGLSWILWDSFSTC